MEEKTNTLDIYTIDQCLLQVNSTSPVVQGNICTSLPKHVSSSDDEKIFDMAARIMMFAFSAWTHLKSRHALVQCIKDICQQSSAFTVHFATYLSDLADTFTGRKACVRPRDDSFQLYRCLVAVLSVSTTDETKTIPSDMVNKLMKHLVSTVQSLGDAKMPAQRLLSYFTTLIAAQPEYLDTFINMIQNDVAKLVNMHMLALIILFLSKKPTLLSSKKELLLKWYNDSIICFCGKGTVSNDSFQAWNPLFITITIDEFNTYFIPGIDRMLNRDKPGVLSRISNLLPYLTIDLTLFFDKWFNVIFSEMQSREVVRREVALCLFESFLARMNESKVSEMVEKITTSLSTRAFTSFDTRTACLTALRKVCKNKAKLEGKVMIKLCTSISEIFPEFMMKESNADVKHIAYSCLTESIHVLVSENVPISQNILDSLVNGSSDSKFAMDCFRSIHYLLCNDEKISEKITKSDKLETMLIKYIEESIAKPALRHNGLLSLGIGFMIFDEKNDNLLSSVINQEKSYFNAMNLMAVANVEEAQDYIRSIELILLCSYVHFKNIIQSENMIAFMKPLIFLGLHSNNNIRECVYTILSKICHKESSLNTSLLSALTCALFFQKDTMPNVDKMIGTDQAIRSSSRKIIRIIAKEAQTNDIPLLAFVCHSDIVSPPMKRNISPLWQYVSEHLSNMNVNDIIISEMSNISTMVFSKDGLFSNDIKKQQTIIRMLTSMFHSAPVEFTNIVITHMIDEFKQRKDIIDVTDEDVAIYKTPSGEVCHWIDPTKLKLEVVDATQQRAKKGLSEEELEWERKYNEAKASKKVMSKEEKKELDKILREQDVIRQHISSYYVHLHPFFRIISSIFDYYMPQARTYIVSIVMPKIMQFLGHPLLDNEATNALVSLCNLYFPSSLEASSAAASVKLVITGGNAFKKHGDDKVMAEHMLRSIAHEIIVPNKFNIIMPVMKSFIDEILRDDFNDKNENDPTFFSSGIESIFRIIESHVKNFSSKALSIDGYDMISFFHILLILLPRASKLKTSISNCALQLSSVTAISPEIFELIISEYGLHSEHAFVRLCVLKCIEVFLESNKPDDIMNQLTPYMFVIMYDIDNDVQDKASDIWNEYDFKLNEKTLFQPLLLLVTHKNKDIRVSAGQAIAGGLESFPSNVHKILHELFEIYNNSQDPIEDISRSGFRNQPKEDIIECWPARSGVVMCVGECSSAIEDDKDLHDVFEFICKKGFTDLNDVVWEDSLNAGLELLSMCDEKHVKILFPLLNGELEFLDSTNCVYTSQVGDRVREGLIILNGNMTNLLPKTDNRVKKVVLSLLETLKTPSHSVQTAAANSLPPLVEVCRSDAENIFESLLLQLKLPGDENYGKRIGAAFGIGALVKGLKLSSLKKYSILQTLDDYAKDKSNWSSREGAMLAYDKLFLMVGAPFEAYVLIILPSLLTASGDSSHFVREASNNACKTMMGFLSSFGMKRMMPLVLNALKERAWRTRLANVQLLGSMAYCAPEQLSSSLPMIVPNLLKVMADPHKEVAEGANIALTQIGSVIQSVEIKKLLPKLLLALKDPVKYTYPCLETLLKTKFVHVLDAASLSLIVPVLDKGLRERDPNIKQIAAQVTGSMCSIADVNDMIPYSHSLLEYLKVVLVDPIPPVRTAVANALGSLFHGIGEQEFPNLLLYLIESLKKAEADVQRSGLAQGLAQVLRRLGLARTDELFTELVQYIKEGKSTVRESFLTLFVYMPDAFGDDFSFFLHRSLPVVLDSLCDDSSTARELALKAGQSIVSRFATSHLDHILPALEATLIDDDWRIRHSSVLLTGTMLLRLVGFQGKIFAGQEGDRYDEASSDTTIIASNIHEERLEKVLGTKRRDLLMGKIYLMRSDAMPSVGQMAWRVWNSVTVNTPRMLKKILPTLMHNTIIDLASENEEVQDTAAKALGELVAKMGDDILMAIVPILIDKSLSPDHQVRKGSCVGFAQVMLSGHKSYVGAYLADIMNSLKVTLCDETELVRDAAGEALEALLLVNRKRAIDELLPSLVNNVSNNTHSNMTTIWAGLRTVISLCGNEILPMLIPLLLEPPFTIVKAQSLAALASSFGRTYYKFIVNTVHRFVETIAELSKEKKDDEVELYSSMCKQLLGKLTRESVTGTVDTLGSYLKTSSDITIREIAINLLYGFVSTTENDLIHHMEQLITICISSYVDESEMVQKDSVAIFNTIVGLINEDELASFVVCVRQGVKSVSTDFGRMHIPREEFPALSNKKGLEPIWTIYQHALTTGDAVEREQAALGLGEVINLTDSKAVSKFVIKFTGPLIRTVGDRFPTPVKAAILGTLALLIDKCAKFLKAFFPQLQKSFTKALADPSDKVREKGCIALVKLINTGLSRRLEPLVLELSSEKKDRTSEIQSSMFNALRGFMMIPTTGKKVAVESVLEAVNNMMNYTESVSDMERSSAGQCVGVCLQYLDENDMIRYIQQFINSNEENIRKTEFSLYALRTMIESECMERIDISLRREIIDFALNGLSLENLSVQFRSIECCSTILLNESDTKIVSEIAQTMAPLMQSRIADIRERTMKELQRVYMTKPNCLSSTVTRTIIDGAFLRSADNNGPVRKAVGSLLYYALGYHVSMASGKSMSEKVAKAYGARGSAFTTYVKGISKSKPK